MDFEFSPDQQTFAAEVDAFLDAHNDPDVFDLTRENMAQIVDTPKRRAFMAELGAKGWLGLTWPKIYGGSAGEGIYEYLLNERLAGRGGPQIGKGVGIIGKTLIAHGNDFLKEKFLPMILRNEVEFAVGYSEPNAGSDAASMRLKAERTEQDGVSGWLLNGQKTWTTSAHFAEWYWLGTRTDPTDKHRGITLMLMPLDQPGVTINAIKTMGGAPMGDERTRSSSKTSSCLTTTWSARSTAGSSTSRRRSISSGSPCSRSRPSSSASICCVSTSRPPSATVSRSAKTP